MKLILKYTGLLSLLAFFSSSFRRLMFLLLSTIMTLPIITFAHQPVMDMTPRWRGGFGIQFRYEQLVRDRLVQGGNFVSNPLGFRSESSILWTEGVYTFTREHRITFKMPYAVKRALVQKDGQLRELTESGAGDVILGFQNKYYFNESHYTGNFSFTPSIFLPTGSTSRELSLGRGTVDYGVSLSASVEMFNIYTYLDLFSQFRTKGSDGTRPGNVIAFDLDLGVHPYHNMAENLGIFLMMAINGRQYGRDRLPTGEENPNSGGRTFEIAPTFVFYWNNVMLRAQYHLPVYRDLNGTQLAESSKLNLGVGIVFQSFSPI